MQPASPVRSPALFLSPIHRLAPALALLLAGAAQPALALVEGVVDPNSTSSDWAGVVSISVGGGTFSGALIDPWHVLTAAHVVAGSADTPSNVTVNLNYGGNLTSQITASRIAIHDSYTSGNTSDPNDGQFAWHDDVAVVTLSQAVPAGVPTYELYTGTPGINGAPRTLTMVAYGGWSDGVSANVLSGSNPRVKRVGQNRVDDLRQDDEGGGQYELFVFDFDGPTSATNLIGPNTAANLTLGDDVEAGYAGGDSGSPVFINDNGVWKLAGIGAFNGDPASVPGNALQFGAFGGGMLVAPYAAWIQEQAALPVPEPQTWLLWLAGLGLLGGAAARRRGARG